MPALKYPDRFQMEEVQRLFSVVRCAVNCPMPPNTLNFFFTTKKHEKTRKFFWGGSRGPNLIPDCQNLFLVAIGLAIQQNFYGTGD